MTSLQDIAMAVVDALLAVIPRPVPSPNALERCRIISHRGEHDNVSVMENTLEAFNIAREAGVWGIECDIRWTADLVPVICHDPEPARVFGDSTPAVAALTFAQLREAVPQIPTLEEVLNEFGGNTHLMLEIKAEPRPDAQRQEDILEALLKPFTPSNDYHFLALAPEEFALVSFAPRTSCFPVAELNVTRLSKIALEQGYGGLGGHYVLLGKRLQARHEAAGQRLGTGFPKSKNGLFRELNRGIEWIFSNDAVALQQIRDDYFQRRP